MKVGDTFFSPLIYTLLALSPLPSSQNGKRRARKRKAPAGEGSLWDVIVNNDDICFVHILPRLNRTDLNEILARSEHGDASDGEAKRSTRKCDLRRSFEISQVSSISTLEWAWKNQSLWFQNQSRFCCPVAAANELLHKLLELLKWIREGKKCEWDIFETDADASNGNVEMVKYCIENELHAPTCAEAACYGKLEILRYLREVAKAPLD